MYIYEISLFKIRRTRKREEENIKKVNAQIDINTTKMPTFAQLSDYQQDPLQAFIYGVLALHHDDGNMPDTVSQTMFI